MIERGSHKCDERRRARILTYAPTFGRHGSKAYLDRLVKQAVEGNAWHAGGLSAPCILLYFYADRLGYTVIYKGYTVIRKDYMLVYTDRLGYPTFH